MNRLLVFSTYLLILLGFTSCGVDKELEIQREYLSVEDYLTAGDCDKALSAMLAMGEQVGDADYYKLLASAYGCKAGFSVVNFFANDITKITTAANDFVSALSTFQMAEAMTDVDDLSFFYMQKAVDTLIYSGGTGPITNDPSASLRKSVFGDYYAADIDSFLMYMLFTRLGMSAYLYGNTLAGIKGDGAGTNSCFFKYATFGDGDLSAFLGTGNTGACTTDGDDGSPALTNVDNSLNLERACMLVTEMNILLDILENLSLGDITDIDLSTLLTNITTARDDFKTNVIDVKGYSNTLLTVKNKTQCVTDFTGIEVQIGYYIAAVFETSHSR